jgi:hypothetical protein
VYLRIGCKEKYFGLSDVVWVFENGVEENIWKRKEVTEGCRKMHDEELHNSY